VSQTSANLIRDARLWPNSKPLEIISPAIDRSIFKPNQVGGRAEHPLSPKSLVYSGSYMPYKGVSTIAAALSQLAEFELHLVSKASEEEQIKIRRAAGSAANRVFFHGGLSDEAYAQLLRESFAMVSASADEGFGIPLIEAMASGLPVVCSDIKIFHEVTGGVAVFFDPNDTNDLVAALQGLEDTTIKSLRSQSIENSKRFDWSGSAKKLDALIERLLTSP
jgi:glycosyltransferase involved in cell wall biosynthesis